MSISLKTKIDNCWRCWPYCNP